MLAWWGRNENRGRAMSDTTIIGNMLILGSDGGGLSLSGNVYSTIAFDPGAAWALTGTVAELADGQTITGFTLGDTIVLDSFSEVDTAFTQSIGLVMSSLGGWSMACRSSRPGRSSA